MDTTKLSLTGIILASLVLAAGAIAVAGSPACLPDPPPGHGFTAARGFPLLSLANGPTLRDA